MHPSTRRVTAATGLRQHWRRWIGGALFLCTGAGLLVHLLVGLPLAVTVPGAAGLAASLFLLLNQARPTPFPGRRIRVGLLSGLLATIAYDLSRLAVVTATRSSVDPFAAWPLFGAGLAGTATPDSLRWVVGAAFHMTNGLLFAVAYTVWLGERGPGWGVLFALGLEAFMLGLYPGWLNIRDTSEFTLMSITGHLSYGLVLGTVTRRLLAGRP